MKLHNLQKHIPEVQATLRSFLTTLLGQESRLQIAEPVEVTNDAIAAELGPLLNIYQEDNAALGFSISLAPEWLPLLSQSMLGEAVAVGDAGYEDLSKELAGQGYGAVRTLMGGVGIVLPDPTFSVAAPGEPFSFGALPETVWKIPFELPTEEKPLGGFALLPFEPTLEEEASEEPTAADLSAAAEEATQVAPDRAPQAQKPAPSQVPVAPLALPELGSESIGGDGSSNGFGLLAEVELEVTVELGRRRLPLSDILRLTTGSVIELEKLVGEALQVYVNNRLIAEGEAVVIDEQFGIRITSLSSHSRDKMLR